MFKNKILQIKYFFIVKKDFSFIKLIVVTASRFFNNLKGSPLKDKSQIWQS
jgi:hypothetical protein